VWRKAELGQTPPSILGAMGVAALLACACVTRAQAGYWHDNFTLFRHALAVTKDNAVAHFHVGTWLGSQQGQFSLARDHFLAAVTADPTYPPPYYPLGLILAAQGKPLQAMAYLREGIKLQPEWVLAIDELAWLLATHPQAEVRNGAEAVRWAERACTLTGGQNAHCWNTLGAACAEAGRFTEAIQATERALALAQAAGQTNEVAAAQARLALYRQQKPCREEP
jgi:tetratricopeptide (TPR) repeat protein